MLAWLKALMMPVITLQTRVLYVMQHNCQLIYLEKFLNEEFEMTGYDPLDHETTKTIYISEGEQPNQIYIYKRVESNPLFIYKGTDEDPTVYLYTNEELTADYCDYVINVPEDVLEQEALLVHKVEYYNPFGKDYKIKLIE